MEYIKRALVELFTFLEVDVVNYLAVFFLFLAAVAWLSPEGFVKLTEAPAAVAIVTAWSWAAVISVAWFSLSEFVYCWKLQRFVAKVDCNLDGALAKIQAAPEDDATKSAAEKLAKDAATIEYYNRITTTSTYEALYLVSWNLGYLAIPLFALFGANPMQSFSVSFWPVLMLPAWCLVGLGTRYMCTFLLSRSADRVADKYIKVVEFSKRATSVESPTN